MKKFSVLMSIYAKEIPEYFHIAMTSIWDYQTIKPNEIVLIQDGPLPNELLEVIRKWSDKLNQVLVVMVLDSNLGTGDAKRIGLELCSNELVAIMDTDDIAICTRFEKQLNVFDNTNVDICGGWISEFDYDPQNIQSYRKVPQYNSEIIKYFKIRNAMNHPSIMFKRQVILNAGNYQKMPWFEDYYLWVRAAQNGAIFYNLQEPIINMRAGYGQLKRRHGLKYALAEINFLYVLYKLHFIDLFDLLRNILLRIPLRLLPQSILKFIYAKIR